MLPLKENLKSLNRIQNPAELRLDYLRLDKNENIINFPSRLIKALQKEVTAEFITAYPDTAPLYSKLAKYLKIKTDNLYLSSGSDGSIKSVFEAFVGEDDQVLVLSPSYAMFYVYANMFKANLKEIFYENDFSISKEKIISEIKANKPRLVCIANPNSPIGCVIKEDELEEIIKVAGEFNTVVLMDEAYHLFYSKSCIKLIKKYPNLVVTRTFSKAFGLASARLGYAVGHKDMIECLHKTRPMYETNAFAIKFAEIMLDHNDLVQANVKELKIGKKYLEDELKKQELKFIKSYTNFVCIDVGSKLESKRIVDQLKKKKILIKGSFSFKPLENYIRLNVGSIKQMKILLSALKDIT